MRQFPDRKFKVEWKPFELNSQASTAGVNKEKMYNEKFGAERVAAMIPQMKKTGLEHGIKFSFGGNTGNTFDSHRLILLAEKEGKDDAVVEELFKNYFEEEKFLGDIHILEACAKKCGLDMQKFEQLKNDKNYLTAEIRQMLAQSHAAVEGGVPHFIVNDKYSVGGAQPAEAFVKMFREM